MQDHEKFDFYNEYVKVKSDQLLTMMDDLLHDMEVNRCNVRHFKNWEMRMTTFKDEYRIFHKNILQQLNSAIDHGDCSDLEKRLGACCEQLEDHYEILAQVYLSKRNEIEAKTTYFEVKRSRSLPRVVFITHTFVQKRIAWFHQLKQKNK